METFIPVLLLSVAVLLVVNYAKAVMYRRVHLLPRVTKFINNESIPIQARFMAMHSFEDSLDYSLPLKMNRSANETSKEDLKKLTKSTERFFSSLDTDTKKELFSIIDECIRLNIRLAFPMYIVATLTAKRTAEKKKRKVVMRRQAKRAIIYDAVESYDDELKCA